MAKHRSFGIRGILSQKSSSQPQKPAKRTAVWMNPSDDEQDFPAKSPTVKGTHKSPRPSKRAKLMQANNRESTIDEQRRQLPIAHGTLLSRVSYFSS